MELTGPQFNQIYNALLEAFDEASLRQMVSVGLGEEMSQITGGKYLNEIVFSLVTWAEQQSRVQELIDVVVAENPHNIALRGLQQAAQSWHLEPPARGDEPEPYTEGDILDSQLRHVRLSQTGTQVSVQSLYSKSWALVIGIDDYGSQFPRLGNAVNDAREVGDMLEHVYGFDEVHRLFNVQASQATIRQWLFDTVREGSGPNDRLIFFFAGHGTSLRSFGHPYGYLIPQDARDGKYYTYLDMEELRRACGLIAAKHILFILDCCFSGIAAVTARSMGPDRPTIVDDTYLQSVTKRRAWQVLTAGASDELAADSGSRPGHSAFTNALLEALQEGRADRNRDGIITAWDVAAYIKPEVSRATARYGSAGQTPFFNYMAGSEQGDFVFIVPSEPALAPVIRISEGLPPAYLVLLEGASYLPKYLPIGYQKHTRIGRSDNSDLVINGSQVSRVHASILRTDEGYYIRDEHSGNGTVVNRIRLSPHSSVKLHEGDVISFGTIAYKFVISPTEQAE
jgi:hypothetical protein